MLHTRRSGALRTRAGLIQDRSGARAELDTDIYGWYRTQFEAKGETLSAEQKDWLEEARAALPVPDSLVKTMSEYSHDPRMLYAYRNRLAELIDRSGTPGANPWGTDFNVRGFGSR